MKEDPKNTNLHKLRAMGKSAPFEVKGSKKEAPMEKPKKK